MKDLGKNISQLMDERQDPDIFYFFIQDLFNNINKTDFSAVHQESYKITQIAYLEVFRSVMQYIEEFALYFFAYCDKNMDLAEGIVKTKPKVIKTIFQQLNDDQHDIFAENYGYSNYNDVLMQVFTISSIPITVNRKEIYDNLKKGIDKIAWFFIYYSDLYNAIKHGHRIFPKNISKLNIGNKEELINIDNNEAYFEAICKDSNSGGIYTICYPIKLLVENSIRVLEDVHELFNFMRKKNGYKKSSPFKYNVTDNFLKYVKAYNEEYCLFLRDIIELNKIHTIPKLKYAKLIVNRSVIQFNLTDKKSLEYPFLIRLGEDYYQSPKPGTISDLKISYSSYLDITQLDNLMKLKKFQVKPAKNIKIIFVNDKTGETTSKLKFGELNSFQLPIKYKEDIIALLVKFKKITQKTIPVPQFMSQTQIQILNFHKNKKKWKLNEVKKVIKDLKKNKNDIASIIIRKVYLNGEIDDIFLGTTKNMNILNFTIDESPKRYKTGIKELVDNNFRIKVFMDPNQFINRLKSTLSRIDEDTFCNSQYSDEEFGMEMSVKLNKKYWYNEYLVRITIKFMEKI